METTTYHLQPTTYHLQPTTYKFKPGPTPSLPLQSPGLVLCCQLPGTGYRFYNQQSIEFFYSFLAHIHFLFRAQRFFDRSGTEQSFFSSACQKGRSNRRASTFAIVAGIEWKNCQTTQNRNSYEYEMDVCRGTGSIICPWRIQPLHSHLRSRSMQAPIAGDGHESTTSCGSW